MARKKYIAVAVIAVLAVSVVLFIVMTGISSSPVNVKQKLCLKNLSHYLFAREGSVSSNNNVASPDKIVSILEVPFFRDRTPRHFIEIEEMVELRNGTGVIVLNPEFKTNNAGWIAIYLSNDIEAKLKGNLTLDDSGSIIRKRKDNKIHEVAGVRYYLHTLN